MRWLIKFHWPVNFIGQSFQEYSWIQDFDADLDFFGKSELGKYNGFSDLFSVYLNIVQFKHIKGKNNESF